ncbi:hypothetical protein [Chamaesiphon sp.]|uniref:hypothetical protein n=1 Tax=Chamaesiphon sp. TaxID=2814140 RepID=UPI0035945577
MNSRILIGSTVYGSAGVGCKVLAVDGDTLTIKTSKGEGKISISRVVKVEPLSLLDRLLSIASVGKQEATQQLTAITLDFNVNSIYEASLDLEIFFGTFIRRSLSELSPVEFEAIGNDGSEGKYGLWVPTDSPPPNNLPDGGIFTIGDCVTHTDLYHCYGADVGIIELVDSFGDYHVRWKSDGYVGRYSVDNLKLCEIVSRSHPYR